MAPMLLQVVESGFDQERISFATAEIHAALLSKSRYLGAANFTRIHPDDLGMLFDEYDAAFFGSSVRAALGATPIHFGLSRRMTSAGGRTARYKQAQQTAPSHFEILVSSTMLFECFTEKDHRPITVCGILCRDRLEALQRIMEHELVHLIELLLWERSSCTRTRFQAIARRFFGHTDHRHNLITPRESAFVNHGIRPGCRVRFEFEGVEYTGTVNRVNRRATVLVEHPNGQMYADGKRYQKFYIPAQLLMTVD